MTVATVARPQTTPVYPADVVTGVLSEALVKASRSLFRRRGSALPEADRDVLELAQEIDSLTIVEMLSKLDEVLPFKVTECVVKAGGYGSIAAAVKHVVGRVEAKWNKYHAGGKV